jgi:hypothetical protein
MAMDRQQQSQLHDEKSTKPSKMDPKGGISKRRRYRTKNTTPSLPLDLLYLVIKFSDPLDHKNIANANSSFDSLINGTGADAVALEARKNTYGYSIPDSRVGFSQVQFNDFLDGKGCFDCDNKTIEKSYFSFDKRWCKSCFKRLTVSVSSNPKAQITEAYMP